VTVHVYVVAES